MAPRTGQGTELLATRERHGEAGTEEAASGNIELVSAKESLEVAFAISDRDTRPGIMNGKYRMMIRMRYGSDHGTPNLANRPDKKAHVRRTGE
jgi:hypothetical protein